MNEQLNKELLSKSTTGEQSSLSSSSLSSLPQPQPSSLNLSPTDPDEINLLEYIYVLVKNKWWIIGAAVFGLVLGYGLALVKGPRFVAEAVITAKENENSKTPNLSSFGALSGLVASQLNISANPGLDKIDLILGSRKFNAELIEKYDLLPMVIKEQSPKVYKKWFDTTKNAWNDSFVKPNLLLVGAGLSGGILKKEINKNNTMTIKIECKDSTVSDTLLAKYLEYLNAYIKASVQNDTRENVSYLETQLMTVVDPLLREKIQTLIANELEKEMMVSKEAFKVVDPPIRLLQFKQKKLFPIVFGFGFSFVVMLIVIVLHAFSRASKTKEDNELIRKIKHEIIPFKKMN